jgi:tetratricopeptide (TPR) repeat protein
MKIRMAAALAAFLAAAHLFAGAQCRLSGNVLDSAGAPIEGVTVTISTPGLSSFRQLLKTDAKGGYGTLLPDCTMPYHVRFEKDGFIASEADKKIPINSAGTIDMRLQSTTEAQAKGAPAAAAAAAAPPGDQAVMAFNAGVEAINAGDKAAAEVKFQEAVKKNPDLPAGWQALMTLAYEKQEWAKVIEYGTKATDLDPTQSDLYLRMSDAAAKIGDKKAAAEWKARYAEANPDSPEILYNKGIELYNKGKMKDAEAMLSKAVEADPDFANAHFWLGMSAFNQNKKAPAKEHLQKYLELDPSGKEAATAKEILPLLK